MKPRLKFKEKDIVKIASRYQYSISETDLIDLRPKILKRGFITKDELSKIAYWKAPRSAGNVNTNSDEYIREITKFALSTKEERSRIEVLTVLDGVRWPTASVMLHFFHKDPYPIIDFRALWSVSIDVPSKYNFEIWWEYVLFCHKIVERNDVDMRTLDRALWQYSKENQ
jgi:hypothetical protein